MARTLLKAPLHVLCTEAGDTHTLLSSLTEVRGAMARCGIDVADLLARLRAAHDTGRQVRARARVAENRVGVVQLGHHRLKAEWRTWTAALRARLAHAGFGSPEAARAAAAVRSRFSVHPGRRFAGTVTDVRLVLPELQRQAEALRAAGWHPDLLGQGERIRADVERAVTVYETAKVNQAEQTAAAERALADVEPVLREVRMAWRLARTETPTLPDLAFTELREWSAAPPRTRRPPDDAENPGS